MNDPAAPTILPHILVVDDDARLRTLLQKFLAQQGFTVSVAASAMEAREFLAALSVDLIVLDIMMPVEDGFSLTQSLRRDTGNASVPILLLTARGEPDDRIRGFEVGADDYLSKPFEPRELLLRVQAILRRAGAGKNGERGQRVGRFIFDALRPGLLAGDLFIPLTGVEAALLQALLQAAPQALSRQQLAQRSAVPIAERSIDVQVGRLRKKLEADAAQPRHLLTVRGEGYRLLPDAMVED